MRDERGRGAARSGPRNLDTIHTRAAKMARRPWFDAAPYSPMRAPTSTISTSVTAPMSSFSPDTSIMGASSGASGWPLLCLLLARPPPWLWVWPCVAVGLSDAGPKSLEFREGWGVPILVAEEVALANFVGRCV